MRKAIVAIVYPAEKIAIEHAVRTLANELETPYSRTTVIPLTSAVDLYRQLRTSDTILFGCPASFTDFSVFFQAYRQTPFTGWQDKLVAGFTCAPVSQEDQRQMQQVLIQYGTQHNMPWIGFNVLPTWITIKDKKPNGQCSESLKKTFSNGEIQLTGSTASDERRILELFALRILDVTLHYRKLYIEKDP